MATYTVDVMSSLDGFGTAEGWPGYWGKEGPELLEHRSRTLDADQALVLGAATYRDLSRIVTEVEDPTFERLDAMPKIVISQSLRGPLEWSNSTLVPEDALDAIPRLKAESDVPLRSHGSLSMNRALLAAGLVDRLEVLVFPVITGSSGRDPVFGQLPDFDLDLVESRVLDGRVQHLVYVPTLHRPTT